MSESALDKLIVDGMITSEIWRDARVELPALRQRVSELEASRAELMAQLAAFGNASEPNGATITPNNCRHCHKAAEKMREAAATLADEMFADEVAIAIRALPLPSCGDCNPLAPE